MTRLHDINWFLKDPNKLVMMKPFTRGGKMLGHGFEGQELLSTATIDTGIVNLNQTVISQDTYITEYRPDMHHIILNKIIPHIEIILDGYQLPKGMMTLTQTASFQKLIHSAHVRNLTANNLEMRMFDEDPDDASRKAFGKVKQEWLWRNREWDKYMAINTCKQLGNCATLFWFDKSTNKYGVTNFSYEDGYQIVPNYDEYGVEIARSLVYEVDGKRIIDTYDNKSHYRCTQLNDGWDVTVNVHGFPICPLLAHRGKVAWEYAESSIEMWELMTNIAAVALKRFGTFALAFWGDLDANVLKRDSSTLVINLSSDTTNGKQDVKVLDFPEPQTMDKYLKTLEEKISLFSSTSFITPKDISTTNSGGNGIALAMSNDFALATQGTKEWSRYVNDMVYLHQIGLDLENNGATHYADLKIGARIIPWSLETNNTKITNLQMESTILSTQTLLEAMPDAAPDEAERVIKERGSLTGRNDKAVEEASEKAKRTAINRNDTIRDNIKQEEE